MIKRDWIPARARFAGLAGMTVRICDSPHWSGLARGLCVDETTFRESARQVETSTWTPISIAAYRPIQTTTTHALEAAAARYACALADVAA
jgi:hypothetical protein